jgi:hypothetical protein
MRIVLKAGTWQVGHNVTKEAQGSLATSSSTVPFFSLVA